ncbi:MAG: galactokinase, partial [Thermodesulfobacteriota bacterium]
NGCGGRFTGAGGGGCLWALGETQKIAALRNQWQEILGRRPDGRLLDIQIDSDGLKLPIL